MCDNANQAEPLDRLIQKLATNRELAKIAAELMGVKFLRLGYDQFLPRIKSVENGVSNRWLEREIYSCYEHLLNKQVASGQ